MNDYPCTSHWHCDPAKTLHVCVADRTAPCPICKSKPSAAWVKREQPAWTIVHDVAGERVRRFAVPGGWLYQVERVDTTESGEYAPSVTTTGWHPPVLVSDKP